MRRRPRGCRGGGRGGCRVLQRPLLSRRRPPRPPPRCCSHSDTRGSHPSARSRTLVTTNGSMEREVFSEWARHFVAQLNTVSGRSMALAGSACCSSSTATPRIRLTRRDAVQKHTPLSARACARACMRSARRALESQARALDCLWGCDAGARVPARQQRLLPDLPASRLDLGAGQRRGRQRLLQPRWLRAVRVTVQQPQPSPVCGFH